ncbi:MAG: F0F1 ATP synthase subunit B [Gammaproteobacteria bacterium]|nr:F0F1 ATP synthase subunit B [Gammaproteobacteria bacterium]
MNINFTLVAQAISFSIFIWFTARFVWPPLMKAVEDRQKKIADGLAAADRGQQALLQAQGSAQEVVNGAKQQSQDLLANTQKRVDDMIEQAKVAAKAEGERQLAAARANVEQEVQQARETLRGQVAALALAGAEQILMREIDLAKHQEVLQKLGARL